MLTSALLNVLDFNFYLRENNFIATDRSTLVVVLMTIKNLNFYINMQRAKHFIINLFL